jgi:DNA-binding XRE family transcriptional regulator/DNA-directed RNA polymerase subunit RPC12/RpoP
MTELAKKKRAATKDKAPKVCPNCGGKRLVKKGHKHVERVGDFTVRDGSALLPTCVDCGEPLIDLKRLGRYQLRAAATVLGSDKEIDGQIVRYARRALGATQQALAERLGYTAETISRIENGSDAPVTTLRLSILALLDEAIWAPREKASVRKPSSKTLDVPKAYREVG